MLFKFWKTITRFWFYLSYLITTVISIILGRAFDDCLVTESIFKLLQIFGSLIQRSLIAQELSDRMPILVDLLNTEMDESKTIYQKQMSRIAKNGKASVDKNMPPMCGQLKWANELKAKKIDIPDIFNLFPYKWSIR